MNKKKKIILLQIYFILFVAGLVATQFFVIKNEKQLKSGGESRVFDFGGEVGKKKIFIQFYSNKQRLYVQKNYFTYCYIPLIGYESSAKITQFISGSNQKKLIEVSSYVGVHSENRQYFYLKNDLCPKNIIFEKNDELSYNISSDEPNFILHSDDKGNILDLIVENRNWDADPLLETVRDIYVFDNENLKFKYARSENFSYPNILPDGNN